MIWFSPISLIAGCTLVRAAPKTIAGETAVAPYGMISIPGGSFAMGAVTNVTPLCQRTAFLRLQ
jgi:hypothetical protein